MPGSVSAGRIYQSLLKNTQSSQSSRPGQSAELQYLPFDVEEERSWILQPELPKLVSFRTDDFAGFFSEPKVSPSSPFYKEVDNSMPLDLVIPTYSPLHDRIRQSVAQEVKTLVIQSLIQKRREEEAEKRNQLLQNKSNKTAQYHPSQSDPSTLTGAPEGGGPSSHGTSLPCVSEVVQSANSAPSMALPKHVRSLLSASSPSKDAPPAVALGLASGAAVEEEANPAPEEECFLARAATLFRDSDMDRRRLSVQMVSQNRLLARQANQKADLMSGAGKETGDLASANAAPGCDSVVMNILPFGVKYIFQEGFSNAVRRPVALKDFI